MADTFTPEQVSQILEEFFEVVGTRQYIGARYVPIFGRKDETSIQWDNSAPYEPLTIVQYQGNSYTSRQYVPAGVNILNEEFWAITGNYNAQIEAYRQEVQGFSGRIAAIEESDETQNAKLAGTANSGLKTLINANTEHLTNVDAQLAGTADSGLKTLISANTELISANTEHLTNVDAQLAGTADSGLKTLISANTEHLTNVDAQLAGTADSGLKTLISANTEHLTAVDGQLTTVNTKLLGPVAAYRGSVCVVFGDSFTDARVAYSEYGQWPNMIANTFGFDLRNYAVSGSGIVHGNANLVTEENKAANEMSAADKAKTSVIIMYYGYNDLSNNVDNTDIVNNFRTFLNVAHTNFPNARIIAIPFNYGAALLAISRETKITSIIQSMRDVSNGYPVEIVDNARFWLLGVFSWFKDSVHPNATGYKQIASYITNAILGNNIQVHRSGSVALEAGVESYRACSWVQQDGLVTVYARFVPTAATSSPETTVLISESNMPPIMCPETLIQAPVNGVNATGLFTQSTMLRAYQYTVPNDATALVYNMTFRAAANKAWS